MEERYIASVDLGTSRIAICIAKIQGQDVQVVYYKETPSEGIRYSYVFNPKKVETVLCEAVSEAQQELKIKIMQVIVGLPRYYVRQETASASIERTQEDSQIQESEIRMLKSTALESYPLNDSNNEVIYGAVAQSFSTEENVNELESDIVGMTAAKLEGNFKVFIGNRRHSINIDNVFNGMGIAIAKKYFIPGITAKAVLKEEQMENGVALIDLGAGVSSVTIFKGKIMRFYAAIPFGGNSITNDIKSECNISFSLADNIKMAYGACMPNKLSALGEKSLRIDDENDVPIKQLTVKYLSEIITARMKEIIDALLYQIQISGYATEDDLRAGVVVTGGGSELVNCTNYIKEISGYSVSAGTPRHFFSCEGCLDAKSASAATSMGMILSAKSDRLLNCTTRPVKTFSSSILETIANEPAEPERTVTKTPAAAASEVPAETVETAETAEAAETAETQDDSREEVPAETTIPEEKAQEPDMLSIEPSVAAAQEDEQDVFDKPTEKQVKEFKEARKKEKKKKQEFSWIKHIQQNITEKVGSMFDEMNNEEV